MSTPAFPLPADVEDGSITEVKSVHPETSEHVPRVRAVVAPEHGWECERVEYGPDGEVKRRRRWEPPTDDAGEIIRNIDALPWEEPELVEDTNPDYDWREEWEVGGEDVREVQR